jgi:hypothetical protein
MNLELDLWTSPKGELGFWTDGDAPGWVPSLSQHGQIVSIASDNIGVHFEHLDRNFYFMGLFIPPEHWAMHFFGAGYLKLAPKRDVGCHELTIHLPASFSPDDKNLEIQLSCNRYSQSLFPSPAVHFSNALNDQAELHRLVEEGKSPERERRRGRLITRIAQRLNIGSQS